MSTIHLTFRTVCTRLPIGGVSTPLYCAIPEGLAVRRGVLRNPVSVRYHYRRRLHSGLPRELRLLRDAEAKQQQHSSAKELPVDTESTMVSRAARLAKEQAEAAPASNAAAGNNANAAEGTVAAATKPKKTLWQKVKDEAVHYWHGTKLLGLEIRISSKLTWKLLNGGKLTRREARQVRICFAFTGCSD